MFRIILIAVAIVCLLTTCKTVSIPGLHNEYVVQKAGNSVALFHYNASGVISEYFLIQQTSHWPEELTVDMAQFVGSKFIHIRTKTGQNLYFSLSEVTSVPSEGKVYPVSGLVYTQIIDRNPKNNKDVLRFAMNALRPSDADCDKSCMSGGCGAAHAMHRDEESLLRTQTHVACSAGYFACVGSILTFSSRCIKNSCCEN